jgi:hypothetical protein
MEACRREAEMLERLRNGRPDAALGEHAAECPSCAEVMALAAAVLDDRATLMESAPLPGSGVVWWRTTMRLRREAARRALRIARLVQVALVVAAVAASIALLVPKGTTIDLPAALASIRWVAVPIFAIGALLIMAPVAVYFVVTEE